jgi:hypothetical protein
VGSAICVLPSQLAAAGVSGISPLKGHPSSGDPVIKGEGRSESQDRSFVLSDFQH